VARLVVSRLRTNFRVEEMVVSLFIEDDREQNLVCGFILHPF
jgi:hypothetical protein